MLLEVLKKLEGQKQIWLEKSSLDKKWFEQKAKEQQVQIIRSLLALENIDFSEAELEQILIQELTIPNRSLEEFWRVLNLNSAIEYLQIFVTKHKLSDWSLENLLDLHKLLAKNVDETNSGKFRNIRTVLPEEALNLPNPIKVPSLLNDLLVKWGKDEPIKEALNINFKIYTIYPFASHNEQLAFLLFNLVLLAHDFPLVWINVENLKYFRETLDKANMQGDFSEYQRLLLEAIERSLSIEKIVIRSNLISLKSTKLKLDKSSKPTKKPDSQVVLDSFLKIGQVAKESGESVPTIRFWLKEGLLKADNQTASGYQLFTPDMIEKAKEIRHLQTKKRWTLQEIKLEFEKANPK